MIGTCIGPWHIGLLHLRRDEEQYITNLGAKVEALFLVNYFRPDYQALRKVDFKPLPSGDCSPLRSSQSILGYSPTFSLDASGVGIPVSDPSIWVLKVMLNYFSVNSGMRQGCLVLHKDFSRLAWTGQWVELQSKVMEQKRAISSSPTLILLMTLPSYPILWKP